MNLELLHPRTVPETVLSKCIDFSNDWHTQGQAGVGGNGLIGLQGPELTLPSPVGSDVAVG